MATIIKNMEEIKNEVKPKFVPGKEYEWKPDDKFVLSGAEFSIQYNALSALVNSSTFQESLREAQKTFALYDSYRILQTAFEKGVEEGVIIEIPKKQEAVETAP